MAKSIVEELLRICEDCPRRECCVEEECGIWLAEQELIK